MTSPETPDASPAFAGLPGSAVSKYHCRACGKLKLTSLGRPHKCGPTDKQLLKTRHGAARNRKGDRTPDERARTTARSDVVSGDWFSFFELTAPVCIRRLFALRAHPRDGAEARSECRAWIARLRRSRKDSAAHRGGGRDGVPDCAQSAGTQNRWTSPVESDDREASGECVPAENFQLNGRDETPRQETTK